RLKLTPLTITRRLIMQKASRHPANSKAEIISPQRSQRAQRKNLSFFSFVFFAFFVVNSAPELAGLRHIVCSWLQVLFHSPSRGSFHLSLAVLVHYRLPRSIYPYPVVWTDSCRVSRA